MDAPHESVEDTSESAASTSSREPASEDADKETASLIEKSRRGNKAAFAKLVNKYKSQVAGIAYRMVNDYDDAKDITQLVFVKTAENLSSYDSSKKFSTWLYRITVNASIDYIRKHKRHAHELLDNYADSLENSDASPAEVYHRKYIRYLVMKAAERLTAKQKAAFILKDMEGHEVSEVAEILNMPEATVRWYVHRARLKLRRELRSSLGVDLLGPQIINSLIRN
jgi:RNA polymerase sigma-70 factor (ECF subfamily)